ncbi:uncharacterized protein EV422DRAFT_306272 [Fimicolochytrium jonesii]|uniref:uncharacterized protein n=1 Tax=Fimicolochytrium jonesii TaxID=1396493 RepID=UPI0022FDF51F|nr:uncharacterized protein EV422DRAFT_306272 [Fimicolochytrium jonesii]KAI8824098.1 hypothetical protein EV422DRAFT_306272 [Fimicolochytrium jonesii]
MRSSGQAVSDETTPLLVVVDSNYGLYHTPSSGSPSPPRSPPIPRPALLYSRISDYCHTYSDVEHEDDDSAPFILGVHQYEDGDPLSGLDQTYDLYRSLYGEDPPPYYCDSISEEVVDELPTYGEASLVTEQHTDDEFQDEDEEGQWGGFLLSTFFTLLIACATLLAIVPMDFTGPEVSIAKHAEALQAPKAVEYVPATGRALSRKHNAFNARIDSRGYRSASL